MHSKQTRDFLIINMPIAVYQLLEQSAKKHCRSKSQEAIVAITNGLSMYAHQLKKPIPFNWNTPISGKFIEDAIKEGRE